MVGIISEQMERIRNSEMQALVTHAELRALQAQINPHFFFNALNTLYGTIPRENATARRLVLNLADLFRVFFRVGAEFSPDRRGTEAGSGLSRNRTIAPWL